MRATFPTKTIRWTQYDQKTTILLQEKNGPCPFIAIVNTLLLQDDIEARTVQLESSDPSEYSSKTVGLRALLESANGRIDIKVITEELIRYLVSYSGLNSETLASVKSQIPGLVAGLDVDVNLTDGSCAKNCFDTTIFDAFSLNFVHGWCREPTLGITSDAVFAELQTYDALQDFLLKGNSELAAEVQDWFVTNSTQLTEYGLQQMNQVLQPDLVSVFFRNNHFSTLYKGTNQDLYLLITEKDFSKYRNYVWQSLNSVSGGEDLFFTGDLVPMFEDSEPTSVGGVDLEMARALQEDEDKAMAAALQKEFNSKKPAPKTKDPPTTRQSQKSTKDMKAKKKDVCVVV